MISYLIAIYIPSAADDTEIGAAVWGVAKRNFVLNYSLYTNYERLEKESFSSEDEFCIHGIGIVLSHTHPHTFVSSPSPFTIYTVSSSLPPIRDLSLIHI